MSDHKDFEEARATLSKFESYGADPQVWADAFARRFVVAVSVEHGFVDTRAVMSAWFHALAHQVREDERRKRVREVLEIVGERLPSWVVPYRAKSDEP